MGIPNLEHVVREIRHGSAWDFRTKAGLCAYTDAVVRALHAIDPNFGHLTKSEGQNHCVDAQGRRHAVDVALYRTTGQVVDFIGSAGFGDPPPENPVSWHEGPVGEYPASFWLAPGGAPSEPPAPPEPPSSDPNLARRMDALEKLVAELPARVAAAIKKDVVDPQVEGLQNQITGIAKNYQRMDSLPEYTGSIGRFITVTSRPPDNYGKP